jgi:hypothetical protein
MAGNYSNTGSWVPQVNTVGLRNVGSYMGHAQPFVYFGALNDSNDLSSTVQEHIIEFPFVTRRIIIKCQSPSAAKKLHIATSPRASVQQGVVPQFQNLPFASLGKNHFISLSPGERIELNIKVDKLFLSGGDHFGRIKNARIPYSIFAELTNIPTARMYTLEGAGLTD